MTTYQFSSDEDACAFAREKNAQGIPATVTPMPWPGGNATVNTDTTNDRLAAFAAELKQMCSDFSDRQNRPYMGDVTAAIDGLLALHLEGADQ